MKLKLDRQQEFGVGGYRPGTHGVDALVVGYYEGRTLRYGGKVRAGFTPHLRRHLTREQMHEFQWLKPTVVAQIRFVEWTAEGHLRHAAFLGLRADKKAVAIRRES